MAWWEYAIPGWGTYKIGQKVLEGTDRTNNEYQGIDRENYNLPGFDDMRDRYSALADRYGQRTTPQAGGAEIGRYERSGTSDFRGDQRGLVDQLRRRASGEESLSALQLKDSLGQNLRQQQALAASARPGQAGMAGRMAAQQAGQLGAGLAGQQAMAGIQERTSAQNMLGGVLQGARGQDIAQSQFNAAQQNQRALELARMLQQNQQFNVGALLQGRGLNDTAQLGALGQLLEAAGYQQRGGMGYEGNRAERFGAYLGQPTQMERGIQFGTDLAGMLAMAG